MGALGRNAGARLSFELSTDEDGSALVKLRGDLDMASTGELEAAIEPIIAASPDRLVIDVSGLRFADSSAIALWVRWSTAVRQVEIREPSQLMRGVLDTMGLAKRLRVTP